MSDYVISGDVSKFHAKTELLLPLLVKDRHKYFSTNLHTAITEKLFRFPNGGIIFGSLLKALSC